MLQTRKAGLMAALSSKAAAGKIGIVDTLVLSAEDAKSVLRDEIVANLRLFKQPGRYKIDRNSFEQGATDRETRKAESMSFRRRVWGYCADLSLLGVLEKKGQGLVELHTDDKIVNNLMRRLDENHAPHLELLMYTSTSLRPWPSFVECTCPGQPQQGAGGARLRTLPH